MHELRRGGLQADMDLEAKSLKSQMKQADKAGAQWTLIVGDQELAKRLGKKGTTNDIAIYNHGSSEGVITYVSPNSEKIQPMLQVLNMIDVPVIVVKDMTKEIGEILIGIDEMKFKKGFIITDVEDVVRQFIKGTSLENFEFTEEKELRTKLLETKVERGEELYVPIDNYFNVKGGELEPAT